MKDLNYYMDLPYQITFIPDVDEGGYAVYFPELPGCVSCGKNLEDAYEMAQDAKRCWLEVAIKDGIEIPLPKSERILAS